MLRHPIVKAFIRHTAIDCVMATTVLPVSEWIGSDGNGPEWNDRNKTGGSKWIELEQKGKKRKERVSIKIKTRMFVIMAILIRL